jgi:hypothetical protein
MNRIKLDAYLSECYSSSLGLKDLLVEVKEVLEAKSITELKEELSQVALYLLIFTHQKFPLINPYVPNWMPWEEDYHRMQKWKEIFTLVGLDTTELNLEWFNQGNNYRRVSKVQYVLGRAGVFLTEEEAQQVIDKVE